MPDLVFALRGSIPRSIPISVHPVWSGKEADLSTGAVNWPCPSGGKEQSGVLGALWFF